MGIAFKIVPLRFSRTPNESVKIDKKPSRNSPCPCGSGAKFKECCGKSGPKKGVFA